MAKDTILKVKFHIFDVEWEDNYEYEAIFFDLNEMKAFIYDNIAVGNNVIVLNKEEVPMDIRTLLTEFSNHF
jgi:hypothetical protein